MILNVLKLLVKIVLGKYKLDDGKTVFTSSATLGAILTGIGMAGIAGGILLNPAIVHQYLPQLDGQEATKLFLSALGVIVGAVRYLIGMRNVATTTTPKQERSRAE